jgi:hypothetical protein
VVATLVLSAFWCIVMCIGLGNWYCTVRLAGGMRAGAVWQTIRHTSRSIKLPLLTSCALGIVSAPFTVIFDLAPPLIIFSWFLGSIALLLFLCLPPGILLLGPSLPSTASLTHVIRGAKPLLRTVVMVDRMRLGAVNDGGMAAENISAADSRLSTWTRHVCEAVAMALLVVIDIREPSESIRMEISLLLDSSRRYKVIFFGTSTDPLLEFNLDGFAARRSMTEPELRDLIRSSTRSRPALLAFYAANRERYDQVERARLKRGG